MIYLSQRDERWGAVKLGASSLDVYHYGCTTTCISMLSDYFGSLAYPDAIAKVISNYTPEGLILWTKLQFIKMSFAWREYGRNDQLIKESLKDPNKAVILQVDDGKHWLVALRPTLLGNDYVCLDPWTGLKCNAIATYKNITGSAHFVRK